MTQDTRLSRANNAYFKAETGFDLPSNMETDPGHMASVKAVVDLLTQDFRDALISSGLITTCRECRDEKEFGGTLPDAEFILWGKLFPTDALGPKCYDHAVKWAGSDMPSRSSQWAVIDLRPIYKTLEDS